MLSDWLHAPVGGRMASTMSCVRFTPVLLTVFAAMGTSFAAPESVPSEYRLIYNRQTESAGDVERIETLTIGDATCRTTEELKAVLAKLPPESRIRWSTGCQTVTEMPV